MRRQIKATSKLRSQTGSRYFFESIGRKQNELDVNLASSVCRCKDEELRSVGNDMGRQRGEQDVRGRRGHT